MISWRKALLAGALSITISLMLLVSGGCSILQRSPVGTPTPTKTPIPTNTPQPTPTYAQAALSATPERSYDHCPLTGLEMADPTFAMRRPLDIKIDNYPSSRPPSGIHGS